VRLRERFFARQVARLRYTLPEQRIRQLLSSSLAIADDTFELRVHRQQRQLDSAGLHAGLFKMGAELYARQVFARSQCSLEYFRRARAHRRIDSVVRIVTRQHTMDTWGSELQHPAHIGGWNEVPGRTHDMRADDSAIVESTFDMVVRDTAA
jgi:hypothetical protein